MINLINLETNQAEAWHLSKVIEYINADRNPEWQDYDEGDWLNGWIHFCEGDSYILVK